MGYLRWVFITAENLDRGLAHGKQAEENTKYKGEQSPTSVLVLAFHTLAH